MEAISKRTSTLNRKRTSTAPNKQTTTDLNVKRQSTFTSQHVSPSRSTFSNIWKPEEEANTNAEVAPVSHGRLLGSVQSKLTRYLGKLDSRKPFDEARLRVDLLKQEENPSYPEDKATSAFRHKAAQFFNKKKDDLRTGTQGNNKSISKRSFMSSFSFGEEEDGLDNQGSAWTTRRIRVDDGPASQYKNDKLSKLASPISFALVNESDGEECAEEYIHILKSISTEPRSETPSDGFDVPRPASEQPKGSKDASGEKDIANLFRSEKKQQQVQQVQEKHQFSAEARKSVAAGISRRTLNVAPSRKSQSQASRRLSQTWHPDANSRKSIAQMRQFQDANNLTPKAQRSLFDDDYDVEKPTREESETRPRSSFSQTFEAEPSKKNVVAIEESTPSWETMISQAKEEMGSEQTLRTVQRAHEQFEYRHRMVSALKSYPKKLQKLTGGNSKSSTSGTTKSTNDTSTLKAFAHLQQDHIKANRPAFNFGKWLASVKSGDASDAFESALAKSLLIPGYLCGDFEVQCLCENFPEGISQLEELDLGTNSLSDSTVKTLASSLGQNLRFLSLANNSLGAAACDAICSYIKGESNTSQLTKAPTRTFGRKLRTLDFSRNALRDASAIRLLNCLSNVYAPDLTNLGLAETQIGRDPSIGDAFRKFICDHRKLTVLDLHYNFLHGHAAYEFWYGVYDNDDAGQLQRIDMSWNQLAMSGSWRITQLIGTVFRDCSTLVHLDLSYNKLLARDIQLMAPGLEKNSTLMGLHLVGNAAACDADGFLIPLHNWMPDRADNEGFALDENADQLPKPKNAAEKKQSTVGIRKKMSTVGGGSEQVAGSQSPKLTESSTREEKLPNVAEREELLCMTDDEETPLPPSTMNVPPGQALSPQQNVEWLSRICAQISPTFHAQNCSVWDDARAESPSRSSLKDTDDVKCQTATAHSLLKTPRGVRVFESASRAPVFGCCWICESWIEVEICWQPGLSGPEFDDEIRGVWAFLSIDNFAHPITMKRKPDGDGTWFGYRVLPPSSTGSLVIFQVNDNLCVAQNVMSRGLQRPITLTLVPSAQQNSSKCTTAQISKANVMPVADWATNRNGAGDAQPPGRLLTITDDPNDQKKLLIAPRNLKPKVKGQTDEPVKREWTFATSVWAPWHWETDELLDRCWKLDWSLCSKKLEKFSAVPARELAELEKAIAPYYSMIYDVFWYYSFLNLETHVQPCVRLNDFTYLANEIYGLHSSVSDLLFVNVQHIPNAMQKQVAKKNRSGLQRFQFMESLVRIAQVEFCDGQTWTGIGSAMPDIIDKLAPLAKRFKQSLSDRREELLCERCDQQYKGRLPTLRAVYEHYRPRYHEIMPQKHGMCLAAFMDFLHDCYAFDDTFKPREASSVFGYTILPTINVYAENADFELGFREFLMALGMVARSLATYIPGMLADLLDEFIIDHVEVLHTKMREWKGMSVSSELRGFDLPPDWLEKLARYLRQAFKAADDDLSGQLSKREFITVFESYSFKEKLIELELELPKNNVYAELDTDHSGELEYVEVFRGLANLKQKNKNQTRALSVLRGVFKIADLDGSGCVSKTEFLDAFARDDIQKLIWRNGLSFVASDLDDMFDYMDNDGSGTLTLEEVMEGFSTMYKGDGGSKDNDFEGDRNIGFLRTIFADADLDKSGSLNRQELTRMLKQPRVAERLERMGLVSGGASENMLSYYFEECDENGDNCIDLAEFENGYAHIRELLRHRLVDKEREKWEKMQQSSVDDKTTETPNARKSIQEGKKTPARKSQMEASRSLRSSTSMSTGLRRH